MSQPDPASLRVSDEERNAVAAQLQDSLDAGRINLSEFDERTRAVYDAATYDELNRLLSDLPGAVPAVPPTAVEQAPPPRPRAPAAPPEAPQEPSNAMGNGALICGLVSVFSFFPFSVMAIVLGAIGIDKANKGLADNRSSALAGLILGSVSLPVWITFIVLGSVFWWGG
ncbi:DUF1707 and DUF4190 domain-containing protein [Glycomyces tenuis]|uniref:DUF1707 and DUF4190 domain-containing protein n=1 Tax=Glycomyces tenuis TaxID=58116 RepID=UPI00040A2A7C|nr:DUF1707 and DUF4190 domain-containing protein [Glycomyces tenuis]